MQDPCAEAQPYADAATALSQNNVYITAKNNIQAAAVDGNEHGVAFGKDANNNITASAITNGGASGGTINTSWPGAFVDLHNHPNYEPPSPGDLYNLITVNNNHNGYNTRMVITPDGSVYALVITNLAVANTFKTNYPSINIGYGPDFPENIADEYNNVEITLQSQGLSSLVAKEMTAAFILEKYNTGIVLLKQDSNGNFKRLRTMENIVNGIKTYSANNCQ